MLIHAEDLTELAVGILKAKGARREEAELVGAQLVESNLLGCDSHGVIRLPRYVMAIERNEINVRARLRVVRERPAALLLDGDWGFGQVAVTRALDLAMDKAGTQGVCYAGGFNCNDVGRLGWYTNRAAERGFTSLMTINDGGANPHVTPWGGKKPLLSTNPICASFPAGDRPPLCMDIATSICSGGKIQVALKRGERLPPGLIVDAEGKPSTRAEDFFGPPPGSLLPLGAPLAGHKGFGLGLMVDILSGALSGAGCSGSGIRDAQGVFLLVMDVGAIAGIKEFAARIEGLIQAVKSAPRAKGVEQILVPGEPEWTEKQRRSAEGIFIEDTTWQEIVEIAHKLGLEGAPYS